MAEARSSDLLTQSNLFFCHKCSAHIVPRLPEYECPQCDNGFIEPSGGMSNSSSSSSSDTSIAGHPGSSHDGNDADSDEAMDDSESERDFLMRILPTAAGAGSSLLWGGSMGGDGARAGGSSSSGEGNSSGSGRRGGSRPRVSTLLMGLPQRRSRMRGPERHQVLAPLLQDLIVHISRGNETPPPFGLFTEELAANPGDYVWGRGGLDAVITHFMGQLENTGPAPLSPEQISAIPASTITMDLCKNKAQCSVCMEDFILEESVKKLRCEHLFHEPCITPWLKMHATCPVCRTSLSDVPADGAPAQTGSTAPRLSSSRILLSNSGSPGSNRVWIATAAGTSGVGDTHSTAGLDSSSSNNRGNNEGSGGSGSTGSSSSSSTFMEDDVE
ncbi:Zinc finger RING-type [Trinorchestia longiramus]|nr:Zinc finger RING-type [Trinorchestia longiramus]